jgi:hypothetical protein
MMHGVPLQAVALSLGISLAETERLLKNERGRPTRRLQGAVLSALLGD